MRLTAEYNKYVRAWDGGYLNRFVSHLRTGSS